MHKWGEKTKLFFVIGEEDHIRSWHALLDIFMWYRLLSCMYYLPNLLQILSLVGLCVCFTYYLNILVLHLLFYLVSRWFNAVLLEGLFINRCG